MLCGYIKPSSGTATMFGKDICKGMTSIHTIMGVCPQVILLIQYINLTLIFIQENVIWGELSGGEHLGRKTCYGFGFFGFNLLIRVFWAP